MNLIEFFNYSIIVYIAKLVMLNHASMYQNNEGNLDVEL